MFFLYNIMNTVNKRLKFYVDSITIIYKNEDFFFKKIWWEVANIPILFVQRAAQSQA